MCLQCLLYIYPKCPKSRKWPWICLMCLKWPICPKFPKRLKCFKCPMCLNCPCVPNVSNAPCVTNVQCVTNVPCVPNVTCAQKKNKALQILIENISTMANINHMRGESHLLKLPLCTHMWGHVGLLLSTQCVLSVGLFHSFLSVCPALSILQAVKHETLTRC